MTEPQALAFAVAFTLAGLALLQRSRHRPRRQLRPVDRRPVCLYRFYDTRGHLVYVGITNHLGRRLTQHNTTKPWWTDVTRITVEHFTERDTAEAAEIAAIRRERPERNIAHNHRRRRYRAR
jgi:predicted GIY-YIG superfamily endonuclease